jgi:hypothetical protein
MDRTDVVGEAIVRAIMEMIEDKWARRALYLRLVVRCPIHSTALNVDDVFDEVWRGSWDVATGGPKD